MPSRNSPAKSLQRTWFVLKTLNLPLLLRSARYSVEKAYAELKYAAEPIEMRGSLKLWLLKVNLPKCRVVKPQLQQMASRLVTGISGAPPIASLFAQL